MNCTPQTFPGIDLRRYFPETEDDTLIGDNTLCPFGLTSGQLGALFLNAKTLKISGSLLNQSDQTVGHNSPEKRERVFLDIPLYYFLSSFFDDFAFFMTFECLCQGYKFDGKYYPQTYFHYFASTEATPSIFGLYDLKKLEGNDADEIGKVSILGAEASLYPSSDPEDGNNPPGDVDITIDTKWVF